MFIALINRVELATHKTSAHFCISRIATNVAIPKKKVTEVVLYIIYNSKSTFIFFELQSFQIFSYI
jgi:hypothetical protein